MVSAFEGNKAETKTMLPVIESFMAAHDLPDVTIVADAGMVFEANQKEIAAAGLSFILGMKIPQVPHVVAQWWREHPGEQIPDGHVFTQPWPAGPKGGRRDQVINYQYRHDRARRTLGKPGQPGSARAVAGRADAAGPADAQPSSSDGHRGAPCLRPQRRTHLAGLATSIVAGRAGRPGDPDPGRRRPPRVPCRGVRAVCGARFTTADWPFGPFTSSTAADDRDASYQISFPGEMRPRELLLRPDPLHQIRWLDLITAPG
jgi:hypothetical protein